MEQSVPVELVVPAGSMETLEAGLRYGADALYFGPARWSLRAGNEDFGLEEIGRAIDRTVGAGKKAYVTLNSVLTNSDIEESARFIDALADFPVSAVIISDPALVAPLKARTVPFHVSTQANVSNWAAARFWKEQGALRVILARELSIHEIGEVCDTSGIECEVFAHGAMCMAYSGRCLLSDYLTYRSSNRGLCSHVCRTPFSVANKDGDMAVEEHDGKTYLFNSRDLCSLPLLDRLIAAGVRALKIEGRNKSAHYISIVTKVYREAIDSLREAGGQWRVRPEWLEALNSVSNRGYTTGFYQELEYTHFRQNYKNARAKQEWALAGIVREALPGNRAVVDVKNQFSASNALTLASPEQGVFCEEAHVLSITDVDGKPRERPNPNDIVIMRFERKVPAGSLLRVRGKGSEGQRAKG
ncbi:MAG: hypothetical protein A2350_08560 [Candidatus Raymondbacteria bacterium RifOxyB12_full_50_8]|uniref:Peptidase family U32 C-terminal domain-containing protein n=1 Tax=Candidatus Raymondbacteria bacterium RIFOXYD12_FULL_49_13 TaxID=1817890 RepID=A0A1F7FI01_UNCRA|nr:MAG: hypothetical protein A2248_21465 [Candidatus Raymondbacteria bacterium RIFOXYA2_FULL_49_16]OGJ94698.1 MAG: hypothetical protein A2350_08560 [Candidatus Raymondbacteria bacterium RifOxyB12_full_50_8]OGK06354.1 MAG: hypothetical protein A2519_08785 [Candidatus Raymondbacteria bacterium RIFOXYD12_FULL_49_13]OGP40688.1 MAG: hypothetical protein A2324_03535 [Candidatus Raymondbacteria bacterium RIFOXYB2_FULL_49_35]